MSIGEEVAAGLKDVMPRARSKVVEHFAEQEATKWAEAMIAGLTNLRKMKGELDKMKPDIVAYDTDGEVVSANWSKGALEERDKLAKKIEKLEKALNKADEAGDFGDLYNLVKQ